MPEEVCFYLNGGGLFTVPGRWWDGEVESILNELGARVYNPWRESKEEHLRATLPAEESRRYIFVSDRGGVDMSQGVMMIAEGPAGEVSSGTAWETGYAYAKKKLVLCIRTDYRGTLNPTLGQCLFEGRVCSTLDELRDTASAAMKRIRESKAVRTSYEPPSRREKIGKVFLSAPNYSLAEERFAEELERFLSGLGYDVIFPQGDLDSRGGMSKRLEVWSDIFQKRITGLDQCDAVVALLEGADCDAEMSWDCGYGYSKYKPVFGLRTDFRSLGDLAGTINLMLEQSIVGSRTCSSFDEIGRQMEARR